MFVSGFAAMAQVPQVVLPWMPSRDTNHIRTIRNYSYDTVTLERELVSTWNYDRHGYHVGPHDSLTFNEQGLLTRRVGMVLRWPVRDPRERLDTTSIRDISYSPDGVIQRIKNLYIDVNPVDANDRDTTTSTYELISYKSHPTFGLLEYTFNGCYTDKGELLYCDTVFYRREYDEQGRLLRQYTNYMDNPEDITFHYRPDGRVDYRVGYYYEWSDSLSYHYDANGVLTHMTGKEYSLGMEADLFIRCQPDGRRIEAHLVWHVYDDDEGVIDDGDTEIQEYDSHGLFIRSRIEGHKVPDQEREIDYWK